MGNRLFFLVALTFIFSGCSNKDDIDKFRFLEKGNLAFDNRDYPRAVNYYNEAIMKDSTFVDAWNNKGLAFMKHEEYDEAIICFDKAVQYKPEYGQAILNNARANLAVHQYFAAASWVDQLKKVWPDTSLVYFTEGLVFAEQGEPDLAMNAFRNALVLDSTNAESMVNIGNLFYHLHQPDSAIFYLKQAITLDADESNAYNILAMVYVDKKNYDRALEAINIAISLNDKEPFYINNKGFVLFKLNRLSEAEADIIQSMKMDPYNGWTYRNLGLVRYTQKKYADAIRLLEKALKMDDNIDHIYYDLAKAYAQSGNIEKACDLLSKAPPEADNAGLSNELCK